MKSIFTLSFIVLTCAGLKAQLKAVPFPIFKGVSSQTSPAAACDTVNLAAATNNWQPILYTYGDNGYIFGTSNKRAVGLKIIENANYFDISASANNYITGGLAYFGVANGTEGSSLAKSVKFKVYDDAGGVPGAALAVQSISLAQIHEDVMNNQLTEFKFAQPIQLPASKKFYVSIDHSEFEWTNDAQDSIAIVASGDDDTTAAAYQKIRDNVGLGWIPVNQLWGTGQNPLDVNLFIFPYVSIEPDGCSVLPVSIFNFGGSIKDGQAYLNWSTAAEINNKGFYVERSKDGKDFASIGFVQGTGNSNAIVNYSYTDVSLKDVNVSKTYYRLNQVDLDGKSTYSKVISLSLDNLANAGKWKLYPNPVKDVATVELNLASSSKVKAQLISRDGKILVNTDKGVLTEGTQQFYINTQNIAKGSYILRVTIGDKTYTQLLIKE